MSLYPPNKRKTNSGVAGLAHSKAVLRNTKDFRLERWWPSVFPSAVMIPSFCSSLESLPLSLIEWPGSCAECWWEHYMTQSQAIISMKGHFSKSQDYRDPSLRFWIVVGLGVLGNAHRISSTSVPYLNFNPGVESIFWEWEEELNPSDLPPAGWIHVESIVVEHKITWFPESEGCETSKHLT